MQKFSESAFIKNYNKLRDIEMKSFADSFFIFYLLQELKPKNLLEIGIFESATFSLLYESAGDNSILTGIDTDLSNNKFDILIKNKTPNKQVKFIQVNSIDFKYNDAPYDFIHIDGEHEDKEYTNDLNNSIKNLSNGGIILIDDYLNNKFNIKEITDKYIIENKLYHVMTGVNQMLLTNNLFTKNKILNLFRRTNENISKFFQLKIDNDIIIYKNLHNTVANKFYKDSQLIKIFEL